MTAVTVLHAEHVAAGARMVDFAGYAMPVQYRSQLDEHRAVRAAAGMFDVSHMNPIDFAGEQACAFLQRLLACDPGRLADGEAQYGALLADDGGVLDDLIVYRVGARFRVVFNAGTRAKVAAWLHAQARATAVTVTPFDAAIIAVQGPQALAVTAAVLERHFGAGTAAAVAALANYRALAVGEALVARTGYTGEDGLEAIVPAAEGVALWRACAAAGVVPCGLGARDTLRLEAGMNLYGHEMDEAVSPLRANMAWTVHWDPSDRQFIGRAALEAQRAAGIGDRLVGIRLEGRGVLREGLVVRSDAGDGLTTSGAWSPVLECGIGLARMPRAARGACTVEIRGKAVPARLVRPQFVRHGTVVVRDLPAPG